MLSALDTRPDAVSDSLPLDLSLRPDAAVSWAPAPLCVDSWTVLRMSRYRRREEVVPPIWEAARAMTARAADLAEPRALLRLVRVAPLGADRVRLAGGPIFTGRAPAALLAGCPTAVAFVLTLGPRLEAESGALAARRELLEAFLLETAGWATIEAAVRALRQNLRARGGHVTHRLGPGHRDWPVGDQRALVDLLAPPADLVRLSDDGLLVPFKSVSGVFGLGPTADG